MNQPLIRGAKVPALDIVAIVNAAHSAEARFRKTNETQCILAEEAIRKFLAGYSSHAELFRTIHTLADACYWEGGDNGPF